MYRMQNGTCLSILRTFCSILQNGRMVSRAIRGGLPQPVSPSASEGAGAARRSEESPGSITKVLMEHPHSPVFTRLDHWSQWSTASVAVERRELARPDGTLVAREMQSQGIPVHETPFGGRMAIRNVEGFEVLGYDTLEQAVKELFDLDLAMAAKTIRLLSQGIGAKHEDVPDLLTDKAYRAGHQKAASEIMTKLTTRYSDQQFSRAKVTRLIAAVNPWFKPNMFSKIDRRLDDAAATLVERQGHGPKMAAEKSAEADLPADFTHAEMEAFIAENQARLARGEKPLKPNAWRRLQG
jgi:hypothetical protein